MFGTAEQKERWLHPLLDGEIRSAFAMTEPEVASSDATNISTLIEQDGDSYVINGRKWWTTVQSLSQKTPRLHSHAASARSCIFDQGHRQPDAWIYWHGSFVRQALKGSETRCS